jgi:putative phage-type endonuclease
MKYQKRKKPKEHGYQSAISREDWLRWRNGGIGGSDAGVALGVNPYSSPLRLYLEKKKGIRFPVSGPAIDLGHQLEPLVIAQAQIFYPKRIKALEELPMMSHPDHPWMLATVDAGVPAGSHGPGIVEAKTSLSRHGHMGWLDGNIPAHYRAQVLHYLAVTGRSWGCIVALTEGPNWYKHIIEPDRHELEELIEAEYRLWKAIQEDDFDFLIDGTDKTTQALSTLYPEAEESKEIDLRGNAKAEEALLQYLTSKRFEKAAGEDKKEAENQIKSIMGDHEVAHFGTAEIKWKNTARGRRFTVKEL